MGPPQNFTVMSVLHRPHIDCICMLSFPLIQDNVVVYSCNIRTKLKEINSLCNYSLLVQTALKVKTSWHWTTLTFNKTVIQKFSF